MADKKRKSKLGSLAKKTLIGLLVCGLVVGGIAGGMYAYRAMNQEDVKVYSVSDFSMSDYWGDTSETYGLVKTEGIQQIYLSNTQTVTRVYVIEGQDVNAGDPLIAYDTTLSSIDLTRAEITIKKQELNLENAKKELEAIKKLKASSGKSSGGGGSYVTPEPTPQPTPEPTPQPDPEIITVPRLVAGDGTADSPYIYQIPDGWDLDQDTLVRFYLGQEFEETDIDDPSEDDPSEDDPSEDDPSEDDPSEDDPSEDDPSEDDPSGDDPGEDQPSGEEPGTDDPSSEEPKQDEPSSGETDDEPSSEEPKQDDPSSEEAGQSESSSESADPAETDSEDTDSKDSEALQVSAVTHMTSRTNTSRSDSSDGVYVVLLTRENDDAYAEIVDMWGLYLTTRRNEVLINLYSPDADAIAALAGDFSDELSEEWADELADYSYTYTDYTDYSEESYTAAEIAQMRAEKEEEIRDLEIEIKIAKIDLEKKQKEVSDGIIYAELDGEVTVVRDPDEAYQNGETVLEVSAGGGYYIQGTMTEMELGKVTLGQEVSINSWQTGTSCSGTITEISDYPTDNGSSWSDGNTNVSYYPFTVFVEADAGLQEYDYVDMEYSAADEDAADAWYLETLFIRTENGKSYVYVLGEDDKLERREVATGRNLWGSYTQIKGGLSRGDFIAFPYGDAAEGAKAVVAEAAEFYDSY